MAFLPKDVKLPQGRVDSETRNTRKRASAPASAPTPKEATPELRYTKSLRVDRSVRVGGKIDGTEERDEQFYVWVDEPQTLGQHWQCLTTKQMRTRALTWLETYVPDRCTNTIAASAVDTALSLLVADTDQVLPKLPKGTVVVPVLGAYLHIDEQGVIRAKDAEMDLGVTHTVPARFDATRVNPQGIYTPKPVDPESKFGKYLHLFFPDEEVRLLLQEAVGASILPTTFELAFQLTGGGSNGKSTLLHLLRKIHPQNMGVKLQALGTEFGYAGLQGKTLYTCTEAPDFLGMETEQAIKALISRDPIALRGLYKDPITILPRGTLWFAINSPLRFSDHSYGLKSKIRNIPCRVKMDRTDKKRKTDYHLLITEDPAEMAQVLDWMLEGAARLRRQGHFTDLPESLNKFAQDELLKTDNVLRFLTENDPTLVYAPPATNGAVEKVGDGWLPKQEIYRAYKDWCPEHGARADGDASFWDRVRSIFEPHDLGNKHMKVQEGKGQKRVACVRLRYKPLGDDEDATPAPAPVALAPQPSPFNDGEIAF